MRVLLPAVLGALQAKVGVVTLSATNSSVEIDGQPPPFAGQVYVVVHPGGSHNSDINPLSLDETYDLFVTITMRAGYVPQDRLAADLVMGTAGLYAIAEAVRAALHGDYSSIVAGNTSLGGGVNGFVEPIRYGSCSKPIPQGPSWFWADGQDEAHTGVSLELSFPGSARRVQTLESEE